MLKRILCISLCLAILLCSLTACSGGGDVNNEIAIPLEGDIKISYKTATAKIMDINNEVIIPATLTYLTTESYEFKISGLVTESKLQKNQKVKKGDAVLTLDATELDFKINEQKINISVAQSSGDSISVKEEELKLEMLEKERQNYIITAPFDGIIMETGHFQVGSKINEGDHACTFAVPDEVKVFNNEGAGNIGLHYGLPVTVKINNEDYKGNVVLGDQTLPSDASKGAKKTTIIRLTDEENKRVIENGGTSLIDAGWATVYAVTIAKYDVLCVPDNAIKTDSGKNYCSVLSGDQKYDLPVETGVSCGGYTVILSGIKEGDVVVLNT